MIRRRHLLAGTGAASALAVVGQPASPAQASRTTGAPGDRTATTPFTLGIASGDATPTAVVLWTRLAPRPLHPEDDYGMDGADAVDVEVRVAARPDQLADPGRCLRVETVTARRAHAFSVHHDLAALPSDTVVHYQFRALGWASPIGRTRTASDPGANRPVTFAVANCQSIAAGNRPGGLPNPRYHNGYRHLAERADVDFVVHLGDYIYEFGRAAHVPPRPCRTVDEYRTRYAQYKMRPELAAVHARLPFHHVPDDHEFFNDVHGGDLRPQNINRFNHAAQAYWEHMPFRLPPPGDIDAPTPNRLDVDRRLRWGRVLDLFLADTRQYRSSTTMLGAAQQRRLLDWLADTDATWTTLAFGEPLSGFGAAGKWLQDDRSDITALLAGRKDAAPTGFNPMVLSGDAHCGMVSHVRLHGDRTSPLVATEFVNAPMSSGGRRAWRPELDPGALLKAYNKGEAGGWRNYNGYTVHMVTRGSWRTEYVLGDQVSRPDGEMLSPQRWVLPVGQPVGSVQPRGSTQL